MATVLNGALNAVLAARPDPARALAVLAEELRRSAPVAPSAPPLATPVSAEEAALQQAVQNAMGMLTAVRERPPLHANTSSSVPSHPPRSPE